MPDEMKNVFISHIHEDDPGLDDLKNLVERHGLILRDASITAEKPNAAQSEQYIKSEILAPRINWASTVIVYISPDTKESDYVDWEIDYARKQGKRIVGVWELGSSGVEVPEALEKYANAVVGWDGNRIIDAIEGRIDDWTEQGGNLRPEREIVRVTCR